MSKPIIERKFAPLQEISLEARAEGDSGLPDITGYSALFDSETIINSWWGDSWREVIRSGFFAPAIKDKHDVRALFNHDANFVLGRSTSPKKTLVLEEKKKGLFARISPPNNTIGRDVVESIERGDISGQSFAFTIASEKWTKGDRKKGILDLRELVLVDRLYDVGPVTYPAFEDTDISVDRNAMLAQADCRARGLRSFGESLPGEVSRELSRGSIFQVPKELNFSGLSAEEFRKIVREEVTAVLSEDKDAPIEEAPAEKAPEEAPAEVAPVEEAPAEEKPAEAPPVTEDSAESERQAKRKAELLRLERICLGV